MDNSDLNRAIELQKSRKTAEARDLLMKILKENPRLPAAWMWLANTYPDNFNRIKVLTTCLRFNPGYANAQRWLKLYEEQEEQKKYDPFGAELLGISDSDSYAKKQRENDGLSQFHAQSEVAETKDHSKGKKIVLIFISTTGVLVLGFLAIVGLIYARSRGVLVSSFFSNNKDSTNNLDFDSSVSPTLDLSLPMDITNTEPPLMLFTNTPEVTNTPWQTRTPVATYTPQPTKTPTTAPTPSFVPQTKSIGPIYDSLRNTSYSMEITVTDINWLSSDGYSSPKNGNVFLVVYIKTINLGPSSVQSFGSGEFQILDSNGLLHDYTFLTSIMDTCQLDYVDMLPNAVLEGCIAFEVPKNGKLELIFAPYQYEPLTPGRYLSVALRQ